MSKWDTSGLSDNDRFWFYVQKSRSCWEWTGAKGHRGYGRFRLKGKTVLAHRLSFEIAGGEAVGMLVLHRCDNPSCVRPDHLFLGTDADNMDDKAKKMRAGKSLSETDARAILKRARSGEKLHLIANDFGVSRKAIQRIKNGNSWRYL